VLRILRTSSLLVSVLLAAGGSLLAPGSAHAAGALRAAPVDCPTAGKTQTKWSTVRKPYKLVRWASIDLAAGVRYNDTETLTHAHTFTASVTSSTSVSAGFKVTMLAKLQANTKIDLQALKSSTDEITHTIQYTIEPTNHDRKFVFFKGVKHVTGNWKWRKCRYVRDHVGPFWSPWVKGKAGSWDGEHKGVINCATKQKKGSIGALARSVGC
jgi:hypothetical protein